ncbi:MAG: 50S ribosomal protein L7/L12 [uncultured bacterium]|nr:MAG: 50S ribosomal protein L7/L12 [uncultured bacterium]
MTKKTINEDKILQIEALRKTISSAEETIQSAKAMLLQLEGKNKISRNKKIAEDDKGNVVYGTFDGQIMVGDDGKQYPVPANYASKSKLIEGDMLKLSIDNGSFMYKQVGPIERKNLIGVAGQDEGGNYFVISEGVPYKILLASITYFKIEPGDEVVITIPAENSSIWAAIENVLQKNSEIKDYDSIAIHKKDFSKQEGNLEKEDENITNGKDLMIDEWMSDIEEIKKEIQEEKTNIQA